MGTYVLNIKDSLRYCVKCSVCTEVFLIFREFILVLTAGLFNAYINFKWAILVRPAYSEKGCRIIYLK
jgi:hypothetical protein